MGGRHGRRVYHWDGLPSSCQVNLKEGVLQIEEEEVPLSTPQVLVLPLLSPWRYLSRLELKESKSEIASGQPEKAVFSQTGVMVGNNLVGLQREQDAYWISEKPKKIKRALRLLPVNLSSVSCEEIRIKPNIMGHKTWDKQIWLTSWFSPIVLVRKKRWWASILCRLSSTQCSNKEIFLSSSQDRRYPWNSLWNAGV